MKIVLLDERSRQRAIDAVRNARPGDVVTVGPPLRGLDQNARYHAMLGDLSRQIEWAGQLRSAPQWKVLTVSGHAVATMHEEPDLCAGLEGEMVSLRESTANMNRVRAASLIQYVQAWGDLHDVRWSAPKKERIAA